MPAWVSTQFSSLSLALADLEPMLRPGQAIALCVLALLTLGVVMVNSAGMIVDARGAMTLESILLSRSTVYGALALFALIVCAMLPVRRLLQQFSPALATTSTPTAAQSALPAGAIESLPGPLGSWTWLKALKTQYLGLMPLWLMVGALGAIVALVYVPGIQRPRNGSHRWITLHVPGLDSIQPSELAKWGMLLIVAWFGARYALRLKSFWLGLVPGLTATLLVAGLVVVEDLGTGALIGAAACIVLLAAGVQFWQMLLLAPVPLAGAVLAIVTNPYRLHRIEAFMNPYLEPQTKGFHMIQSMVAVANGEGFGRGLGHGLQKFAYLPEDTTDFLFAIICEELGIAGAVIVAFLFCGLSWNLWLVIKREQTPFFKLFALGVLATIGLQAIINLAVVTGLGPTKGIALPLLSSGGTGWILTAAALGLVIAIDRTAGLGETRVITEQTDVNATTQRGHIEPTLATPVAAVAAGRRRAEAQTATLFDAVQPEDAGPDVTIARAAKTWLDTQSKPTT